MRKEEGGVYVCVCTCVCVWRREGVVKQGESVVDGPAAV